MSELDLQRQHRLDKIEELRKGGGNPYPNDFRPSAGIPEIIEKYCSIGEGEESVEAVKRMWAVD